MAIRNVLVMNGPNMDMLGYREPEIYGHDTLQRLEQTVENYGRGLGLDVTCCQSNSEAKLIDRIHRAPGRFDAIVYNPAAHTHYSYALRDAISSINLPVIEVHLSDIDEREPFRSISVIAPACVAQIKGLGTDSYLRALDLLREADSFERLGEGFQDKVEGDPAIIAAAGTVVPGLTSTVAAAAAGALGATALGSVANQVAAPAPSYVEIAQEAQQVMIPTGAGTESEYVEAVAADDVVEATGIAENVEASDMVEATDTVVPAEAYEASDAVQSAAVFEGAPVVAAVDDAAVATEAAQQTVAAEVSQNPAASFMQRIAATDLSAISVERQKIVRMACSRIGVGALQVRDTDNIRWLAAVDDVFDEEAAHALLIAANLCVIHTDSRYAGALTRALESGARDIIVNDSRENHAKFAWDILTQKGAAPFEAMLGIEDTITYAEFVQLVELFKTENLAPTHDVILRLRSVKDTSEIVRMQAAQAITDAAFQYILGYMKPGMTERQVQLELDSFMLRNGAEELAFRSIVATGAHAADPHAIAGNRVLEQGDAVVLDFGAKAYGYCSDMTRTVFLGQPSEELTRAWEAIRLANETVEAMLKPGVTGKQAHETAEKILAEAGFEGRMGHGLGHGVGLAIHELPVLNNKNEEALMPGNVVTVEPGIYVADNFGMRLEDCGVITNQGFQVFTQSTHEMVII